MCILNNRSNIRKVSNLSNTVSFSQYKKSTAVLFSKRTGYVPQLEELCFMTQVSFIQDLREKQHGTMVPHFFISNEVALHPCICFVSHLPNSKWQAIWRWPETDTFRKRNPFCNSDYTEYNRYHFRLNCQFLQRQDGVRACHNWDA